MTSFLVRKASIFVRSFCSDSVSFSCWASSSATCWSSDCSSVWATFLRSSATRARSSLPADERLAGLRVELDDGLLELLGLHLQALLRRDDVRDALLDVLQRLQLLLVAVVERLGRVFRAVEQPRDLGLDDGGHASAHAGHAYSSIAGRVQVSSSVVPRGSAYRRRFAQRPRALDGPDRRQLGRLRARRRRHEAHRRGRGPRRGPPFPPARGDGRRRPHDVRAADPRRAARDAARLGQRRMEHLDGGRRARGGREPANRRAAAHQHGLPDHGRRRRRWPTRAACRRCGPRPPTSCAARPRPSCAAPTGWPSASRSSLSAGSER